jgi:hypothetical protein
MSEAGETPESDEAAVVGDDQTPAAVRIYCQMMEKVLEKDSPRLKRVRADATEFLRKLDPQDPIEQMLGEQILWMYARLAHLNYFATLQTKLAPMQILHTAADRLANTVRRHMMAFADYRNPGRKRFTAVRQANFAHQQIVTNTSTAGPVQLHDPPIARSIPDARETILPSLQPGPGSAAQKHCPAQTLADDPRPADGSGQEAFQPKPSDPRPVHP